MHEAIISVIAALLFSLPGQQRGNFMAARTLALMPHEKKNIVRPQWPLCPWPGQLNVVIVNYSPPSAQYSLIVTSLSSRCAQVESHHHNDFT